MTSWIPPSPVSLWPAMCSLSLDDISDPPQPRVPLGLCPCLCVSANGSRKEIGREAMKGARVEGETSTWQKALGGSRSLSLKS